jgi:hypothetical protein
MNMMTVRAATLAKRHPTPSNRGLGRGGGGVKVSDISDSMFDHEAEIDRNTLHMFRDCTGFQVQRLCSVFRTFYLRLLERPAQLHALVERADLEFK